nr:WG repeat-containing protein [Aureispira anguillae]
MNRKGEIIIPLIYDDLRYCNDTSAFFLYQNNTSTLYNYEGKKLAHYPYNIGRNTGYSCNCKCNNNDGISIQQNNKKGVLGCDGRVILPPKYDLIIRIGKNRRLTFTDKKLSIIEENKTILGPIAFKQYNLLRYKNNYLLIKTPENKWGLYALDGTEYLKPKYDSIYFSYNYVDSNRYFHVLQNKKLGIFDTQKNQFLLEVAYDKLITYKRKNDFIFLTKKNDKYGFVYPNKTIPPIYDEYISFYRNRGTIFITRKGNKYGLVSLEETIDPIYDAQIAYPNLYFKDQSHHPMILFYRENKIDIFTIPSLARVNYKIAYKDAQTYILEIDNHPRLYAFSVRSEDKQKKIQQKQVQKIGNLLCLNCNHWDNLECLVFAKENNQWKAKKFIDKIVKIQKSSNKIRIRTKTGKIGILDVFNSKLVLDTVGTEIVFQHERWSYNCLFVRTKNGYIPYDTLGNLISNIVLDEVPKGYSAKYKGKFGKLDKNFNWVIKPKYQEFCDMGQMSHLVKTNDTDYQIIDFEGKKLLKAISPTSYQNFSSFYLGRKLIRLLINKKGKLIAYEEGNPKLFTDNRIQALILKRLESMHRDTTLFRSLANTKIGEHLSFELLRVNDVDFKPTKGVNLWSGDILRKPEIDVKYANQKAYSYQICQRVDEMSFDGGYFTHRLIYEWKNYALIDEKVKELSILDVFGNRDILLNELVKSIQARDDLLLDCANPEKWVDEINEDFSLSKEGVFLHLKNEKTKNQKYDLLVPWANLLKYPSTTVLAKRFISE